MLLGNRAAGGVRTCPSIRTKRSDLAYEEARIARTKTPGKAVRRCPISRTKRPVDNWADLWITRATVRRGPVTPPNPRGLLCLPYAPVRGSPNALAWGIGRGLSVRRRPNQAWLTEYNHDRDLD